MTNEPDPLLLYARTHSEDAFTELVQRYLPLVYASALRRVGGDAHRAEDITQMVFVALARNASTLSRHPNLTGWLFTTTRFLAAKTLRTERRRQAREQEADVIAPDESVVSERAVGPLNALLDDLVADLKELDREVILQRFHRGLRLAEIGREMGVSENAVQKRLDRALEQLKEQFSRRGVASTAAAVALALEAQSAIAVPAGLAAASTGAALTGGTAGLLAGSGLALFTKLQVAAVVAVLAAGGAGLAWQHFETRRLGGELQRQEIVLRQEISVQALRADRAEAAAASWKKAAEAAQASAARPAPAVQLLDPRTIVAELSQRVTKLQREGKPQEAVEEALKCYRTLRAVHPGLTELQSVMFILAGVGRSFPPALAALRELRDTALREFYADPKNANAAREVGYLDARLGEDELTVRLFDQLPPDADLRQSYALIANNAFVAAKRYDVALLGHTFGSMLNELEMNTKRLDTQNASARASMVAFAVRGATQNMEVLAGTGHLAEARVLAEKLLTIDGSDATRAAIREHFERAGQPSPVPSP
jgi:RNA polymerase sigma factor (sigma-70 family)